MARSVLFTSDPDSHDKNIRLDMLSRITVPFSIRRRLYEEEFSWDLSLIWDVYCRDPGPASLLSHRKTIGEHILDFIQRIEECVLYKEFELNSFTWEFAYYIRYYETDEAFCCTDPLWIVTIRDCDGDIVHKNWEIRFDNNWADLSIRRITPEAERVVNHWGKPEERILNAINSHLRIKNFIHTKK